MDNTSTGPRYCTRRTVAQMTEESRRATEEAMRALQQAMLDNDSDSDPEYSEPDDSDDSDYTPPGKRYRSIERDLQLQIVNLQVELDAAKPALAAIKLLNQLSKGIYDLADIESTITPATGYFELKERVDARLKGIERTVNALKTHEEAYPELCNLLKEDYNEQKEAVNYKLELVRKKEMIIPVAKGVALGMCIALFILGVVYATQKY